MVKCNIWSYLCTDTFPEPFGYDQCSFQQLALKTVEQFTCTHGSHNAIEAFAGVIHSSIPSEVSCNALAAVNEVIQSSMSLEEPKDKDTSLVAQSRNDPGMNISVKTFTGKTITLDVEASDTICLVWCLKPTQLRFLLL